MTELPLSARLALYVTRAWRDGTDLVDAVDEASPDIDHVTGSLDYLTHWHELGESALFVALARPGDVTSLPRSGSEARAAAIAAGECTFVAGLGGMLVPELDTFGPPGDEGWSANLVVHHADPIPRHRMEMLDARQADRELRERVVATAAALEEAGGQPWNPSPPAQRARAMRIPAETPGHLAALIERAAAVAQMATAGLDALAQGGPVDSRTALERERTLRALQSAADRALEVAVNVAVMHLAGWRS